MINSQCKPYWYMITNCYSSSLFVLDSPSFDCLSVSTIIFLKSAIKGDCKDFFESECCNIFQPTFSISAVSFFKNASNFSGVSSSA